MRYAGLRLRSERDRQQEGRRREGRREGAGKGRVEDASLHGLF
jgi:hypothetical protein